MSSFTYENTPFKKPKILTIPRKSKLINQDLLSTIQNLTKENSQLKEALADLENDLKEKDETIEECQKIINKLKEEYEKVVREFEFIEKAYNDLIEESNKKTLIISEPKITRSVISLINTNKSENKKAIYKENVYNGKKILSSGDVRQNNEINNLNIDNINKMQKKNINYASIIREKDIVIENLNLKISELNNCIKNQKNFKVNNKITNKTIYDIFDIENTNFSYEDLYKKNDNFLTNLKDEIPEEFYFSNNLKTELIKTELFSGLIREYHFTKFLKKFLEKLNLSKLIDLYKYIINCKNNNIKIIQENNLLKRENKILYKNILELKEQINCNNAEIKNKCSNLIEKINKKSNIFYKYNDKIKEKNNIDKLNNTDIINKNVESINSQKSSYNFSTLEIKDIAKNQINKFVRLSNNIINKNQLNNTVRINRIMDKKKRKINNKEELDTFINNNSLQFSPFMTEGNNLEDKMNHTNKSLMNKTQIQNDNNSKYKKNIFKLKNEFNNIISKSSIRDNLFDSLVEIKKSKTKCFKIKNDDSKKNFNKNNCSEIFDKGNDNIKNKKKEKDKNIIFNNAFFTSDFFVDLIFKINEGIFIKNELNKYKQIYDLKSYENIYLTFKKTCNELKNMTDELNLKMNKSYCLTGTNFSNKTTNEAERTNYLDSSFKVFNTKIINLKKIESEFMNMNEYIKNYLISQEATIQLMYKFGKNNIKFEPIDKLFNLFEDCLSYRINEMNESIRFIRKLLIKLFKNQINCLFISFEYKFK